MKYANFILIECFKTGLGVCSHLCFLVLVEDLVLSKWGSSLWVELNIFLSSLHSFVFSISLLVSYSDAELLTFLKEECSHTIVRFPISLHNRFFFFSPAGLVPIARICYLHLFFVLPEGLSGISKLARLCNYKNEKDWEFWAASNVLFMAHALWKSCTIRFQTVLKYIWSQYYTIDSIISCYSPRAGRSRPHRFAHADI